MIKRLICLHILSDLKREIDRKCKHTYENSPINANRSIRNARNRNTWPPRNAPEYQVEKGRKKSFQFNIHKYTSKGRLYLIFPICNFTILNFVTKSLFAFSDNCFEVSVILSYLDKNKHFSFRSVANLLSKGSCELAVSTLAWPQVLQGMQGLNIFPVFPSADCSPSKDQDE